MIYKSKIKLESLKKIRDVPGRIKNKIIDRKGEKKGEGEREKEKKREREWF